MAETRTERRGGFWSWATIAIVVASILTAWLMLRDDTGDAEDTTPQVETGAASQRPAGARLAGAGAQTRGLSPSASELR